MAGPWNNGTGSEITAMFETYEPKKVISKVYKEAYVGRSKKNSMSNLKSMQILRKHQEIELKLLNEKIEYQLKLAR